MRYNEVYGDCLLHGMANVLTSIGDEKAAKKFLALGKQYFGVANLAGMPDADQISKVNRFLRTTLEPIPNTTSIRAWLENGQNMQEYLYLFQTNWARDIIQLGVFK